MIRLSRPMLVLALSAGCLVLVAIWQVAWPVSAALEPVRPSGKTQATSAPTQGPFIPPARTAYAEIEQRPLFVPSRKPPTAATAQVQAAQPSNLDKYTLLGIIAASDRPEAVLRGPTGDTVHLRAGQTLEGWTLETIQPRKLSFASAGQKQEMELKYGQGQPGQIRSRTNNDVMLK